VVGVMLLGIVAGDPSIKLPRLSFALQVRSLQSVLSCGGRGERWTQRVFSRHSLLFGRALDRDWWYYRCLVLLPGNV
jgi:hypothetical protein